MIRGVGEAPPLTVPQTRGIAHSLEEMLTHDRRSEKTGFEVFICDLLHVTEEPHVQFHNFMRAAQCGCGYLEMMPLVRGEQEAHMEREGSEQGEIEGYWIETPHEDPKHILFVQTDDRQTAGGIFEEAAQMLATKDHGSIPTVFDLICKRHSNICTRM